MYSVGDVMAVGFGANTIDVYRMEDGDWVTLTSVCKLLGVSMCAQFKKASKFGMRKVHPTSSGPHGLWTISLENLQAYLDGMHPVRLGETSLRQLEIARALLVDCVRKTLSGQTVTAPFPTPASTRSLRARLRDEEEAPAHPPAPPKTPSEALLEALRAFIRAEVAAPQPKARETPSPAEDEPASLPESETLSARAVAKVLGVAPKTVSDAAKRLGVFGNPAFGVTEPVVIGGTKRAEHFRFNAKAVEALRPHLESLPKVPKKIVKMKYEDLLNGVVEGSV